MEICSGVLNPEPRTLKFGDSSSLFRMATVAGVVVPGERVFDAGAEEMDASSAGDSPNGLSAAMA